MGTAVQSEKPNDTKAVVVIIAIKKLGASPVHAAWHKDARNSASGDSASRLALSPVRPDTYLEHRSLFDTRYGKFTRQRSNHEDEARRQRLEPNILEAGCQSFGDWHLPFFVRLKRDILQKKSRARRLKSKEETPDDALGGGHGKRPTVARDLVRSCG